MNLPLVSLYELCNSNPEEATNHILEIYSNPESIQQILMIISNPQFSQNVRLSAAIGLKNIINLHKEIYIENPQPIFHDLLAFLMNETNVIIGSNVANSLSPIFEEYGETWADVVQLINHLCTSDVIQLNIIGSRFLIEFIPHTKNVYVEEMNPIIIPLLQKLLSNLETCLIGFELFADVQFKDAHSGPYSQQYLQIFQQMLIIFHQLLINENPDSGKYASYIARSLKRETPFDSPINTFQQILQLASDPNIPLECKHFPMFPINTLIKHFGGELKPLIPNAISIFLNISASQYIGTGYIDEENSRTIITLFEKLVEVSNENDFFNALMELICKDQNPAASFASLCAIYGSVDLTELYEINIQTIVNYIISKMSIQSPSIIELCLLILTELSHLQCEAIAPYAEQILDIGFQLTSAPIYEISVYAVHLISNVFFEVDLDPSYVITRISVLKDAFIAAPERLKPEIMSAIASGIYSCREDIAKFAPAISSIVKDGLSSQDPLLVISSVEALGNLMCFARNEISDLFEVGLTFLSEKSIDPDMNLRCACLYALTNLTNSQDKVVENINWFYSFVLTSAITAIGIKTKTEEEIFFSDGENTTALDIILQGFKLLKACLKHHSEECSLYAQAFPKIFSDFVRYIDTSIAVEATKASVYYILNLQPSETDLFDHYLWAITEQKKLKRCKYAFKAYSKLFSTQNPLSVQRIGQFLQCAFAALSRKLKCQTSKCINEEDRYSFNPEFMEPIYTIICNSFKLHDPNLIPHDQFISMLEFLLTKVGENESLEILGTLGDYVSEGGMINQNILNYALNKMKQINYNSGPDSIYLIRSIIKMHPNIIMPIINDLTTFFVTQLRTNELVEKFYWSTMTNCIAAMFEILFSQTLSSSVHPEQVLPIMLSKLPVKGDYDEAEFIYRSLINYFQANPSLIQMMYNDLIRILMKTLSLKSKTLKKMNLSNETLSELIGLTQQLISMKPDILNHAVEILNDDQFNFQIDRLKQRLSIQ